MKWRVFGFIVLSSFSMLAQQNSISGVVKDSETKEPVPYANVFFANTTFGVSSDQGGKFRIEGYASGKYDLIVTFVGYKNFKQAVEFNDSNLSISVDLVQTPILLNEVVVREDTTDRDRNFGIFNKYFLGETSNAKHCKIINPDAIHLFFDDQTKVLVAHAKEPIQIENNALGYQLTYYLHHFEFDFNSRRITNFGVTSLRSLEARNKIQANRWRKERQRAYYGSMIHFIRAFRLNQLTKEGFEVRKIYQVLNSERPPQQFLDAKLNEFGSTQQGGKTKNRNQDSMRYYMKLNSLPVWVDSLVNNELQAGEWLTSNHHVIYKGRLWVKYTKELEEYGYLKLVGRSVKMPQESVIHFLSDSLQLYSNGYYEDQKDVFIENYWAWSEKISEYVPMDYLPKQKNK